MNNKKQKKWKVEYAPGFWKSAAKCFSNKPRYWIPRTIRDVKYEIIWAWQRVFKGYDDRWTWSTYSMLTDTMIKALSGLKKCHYGYPSRLKNNKEWNQVLRDIIKGFKAAEKISGTFNAKKIKAWDKDFQKGMKLFVKYFFSLWD